METASLPEGVLRKSFSLLRFLDRIFGRKKARIDCSIRAFLISVSNYYRFTHLTSYNIFVKEINDLNA